MDAFEAIFETQQAEQPATVPTETPPVEATPIAEESTQAPAAEVAQEVPPAEPAPPQERAEKQVPLVALLDERDKRKALEAELTALRAKQAPAEETAIPDPYDDPAGYSAFVTDMTNRQALAVKFDLSEDMAVGVHGEEAVNTAKEWGAEKAAQDPAFKQQFLSARNPIDWVVRQHKQADDLALYQRDPVAFARAILERTGQQPVTDAAPAAVVGAGQQPPAIRQAAPPRSIASAPSSGGARDVAVGPLSALDAVFTG